ncbi:hypothetical protein CY34DRAFT_806031 [Suillus luteus UH-Slu-Lm8-n1]|uniref:Uncharacterized protein n=1 Tax=Suillus luteus UH-Slu-Lm8-n1 TaxID=930992 RepID=A0A0D0BDN8_9AGAM|nr:hypothetical protein CY34DRAFT_806031 [Suillus luteus UH-Slu-Lm8-n1]
MQQLSELCDALLHFCNSNLNGPLLVFELFYYPLLIFSRVTSIPSLSLKTAMQSFLVPLQLFICGPNLSECPGRCLFVSTERLQGLTLRKSEGNP